MAVFEIPAAYAGQLEVVENVDTRSDDEILQTLTKHVPVTSEKNIWAFWHAGVQNMPAWCQRNAIDWVRICGPEWTIRVLDPLPDSPNYVFKYVSRDLFPAAFVQDKMDGDFSRQHSADMVRGATLLTHGGAWMDVGSILTRHMDDVCWKKLEDPASPYQSAIMILFDEMVTNFFIAARKGDPFIKRWHDLFIYLWKDHTNHEGLMASPLLSFVLTIKYEKAEEVGIKYDWKVPEVTVMEYITQCVAWMRVARLEDVGDGFSGVDYWVNKTILLSAFQEGWPAERLLGFSAGGQSVLDALTTRMDGDKDSTEHRRAEDFVWKVLSTSSMLKVVHGGSGKLMSSVQLGSLLDLPENAGKDRAPGTFAELLRYGTVHFRQKRASPVIMPGVRPETTLKNGLYEP